MPEDKSQSPTPLSGAQALQKALLNALEELQQQSKETNMVTWAKENLTEFYKMAARILPAADNTDTPAPITEIEIIHTYEDQSQQGTV